MSKFIDNYNTSLTLHGDGLVDNYRNNTMFFYNQYMKSSNDILSIKMEQMHIGYFYFIHYRIDDKKTFIQYSPILVVDFRKVNDLVIVFAINFNIIPLDMRHHIVDDLVDDNIINSNYRINITYELAYKILLKYGFEYAIVEYNPLDIVKVHKISTNILPRFICSGHPKVYYDHRKLYNIWKNALKTREKRYNENKNKLVSELEFVKNQMNSGYDKLKRKD